MWVTIDVSRHEVAVIDIRSQYMYAARGQVGSIEYLRGSPMDIEVFEITRWDAARNDKANGK
ncbi:MAG: hypothetical protein GYA24_25170 [Candidatus Lokiarchaeota archaeon]|nr:hypothetical protein [Candidatus Lokiarchaeota archaeon]